MSENGILVALIAFMASVLVALIAVWRFRRKDRADADAVEEGTISGRFKDADTLMQYIDQRVEERTKAVTEKQVAADAEIRKLEQQFAEITEAVRLVISQQWIWDQRGRPGGLPMLPDPILHKLGLGYIAEGWTTDPTPDSPGSSS